MRSDIECVDALRETPLLTVAKGAAAGLAATLALSALSRVLPGLWNERGDQKTDSPPVLPDDPEDPQAVRDWQTRSQSPAAFRPPQTGKRNPKHGEPPAFTPAGALSQPLGPGPEGLAEQFAFKVASGVFDRDISPHIRPIGLATHLAYGSLWGGLYGIVQAGQGLRPELFGPLYGFAVYAVGPALLVPAMKIMPAPSEEPPQRTSMLILGHLLYGGVLARTFEALERRGR